MFEGYKIKAARVINKAVFSSSCSQPQCLLIFRMLTTGLTFSLATLWKERLWRTWSVVCSSWLLWQAAEGACVLSESWGWYHGGRRPSGDNRLHSPNRHSTIGTRQTEHHEVLSSSANVQSHLTSSFADDGDASWYSVCWVPMVEWWLDCENCRHLMVVGLHDTCPWFSWVSTWVIWPVVSLLCLGENHLDLQLTLWVWQHIRFF